MRVHLIVSSLLAAGASAAMAEASPPLLRSLPGAIVQAQMGTPAAPEKKARPGARTPDKAPDKSSGAGKEPAATDTLASCLAMWEQSTHMSRQEWARACRRVDERIRTLTVR